MTRGHRERNGTWAKVGVGEGGSPGPHLPRPPGIINPPEHSRQIPRGAGLGAGKGQGGPPLELSSDGLLKGTRSWAAGNRSSTWAPAASLSPGELAPGSQHRLPRGRGRAGGRWGWCSSLCRCHPLPPPRGPRVPRPAPPSRPAGRGARSPAISTSINYLQHGRTAYKYSGTLDKTFMQLFRAFKI